MEAYIFLRELLTKFNLAPVGDNKYYLALFIIVFFGFLSQVIIIVFRMLAKSIGRRKQKLNLEIIDAVQMPFVYTVLFWGLGNAVVALQLTHFLQNFLLKILLSVMVLYILYGVFKVFKLLVNNSAGKQQGNKKTNIHQEILPFLTHTGRVITIVWAWLWILFVWNVSLIPYALTISIVVLVLGLAAREDLGNLLAGIVVLYDPNINIGDKIVLEDTYEGEIIDIGLRTSKIKLVDAKIIIVPNKKITNSIIKKI